MSTEKIARIINTDQSDNAVTRVAAMLQQIFTDLTEIQTIAELKTYAASIRDQIGPLANGAAGHVEAEKLRVRKAADQHNGNPSGLHPELVGPNEARNPDGSVRADGTTAVANSPSYVTPAEQPRIGDASNPVAKHADRVSK